MGKGSGFSHWDPQGAMHERGPIQVSVVTEVFVSEVCGSGPSGITVVWVEATCLQVLLN